MRADPSSAVTAAAAADLATWIAIIALLAPIAVAAAVLAGGRRLDVFTIVVGVAAVVSTIAVVGIAASVPFHLELRTWLVMLAVVDAVVLASYVVARAGLGEWLAVPIGAAALTATVAALAIARQSARDQRDATRFTQLWMLPPRAGVAEIGISNLEGGSRSYRLTVAGAGRRLLRRTVRLGADGTWTSVVRVPRTIRPHRITASAKALGRPGEDRWASIWTRGIGRRARGRLERP